MAEAVKKAETNVGKANEEIVALQSRFNDYYKTLVEASRRETNLVTLYEIRIRIDCVQELFKFLFENK